MPNARLMLQALWLILRLSAAPQILRSSDPRSLMAFILHHSGGTSLTQPQKVRFVARPEQGVLIKQLVRLARPGRPGQSMHLVRCCRLEPLGECCQGVASGSSSKTWRCSAIVVLLYCSRASLNSYPIEKSAQHDEPREQPRHPHKTVLPQMQRDLFQNDLLQHVVDNSLLLLSASIL